MRERLRRATAYPYETPKRSFVQVGRRTLELSAMPDLEGRQPLLAYGSNAAPEALARKLAAEPETPLPLIRAELHDYDVVYSAHLSPYGAVPATLEPSPGTSASVFVAYPTARQRQLLAATEPNYERQRLEGIACEPELGEALGALDAFLSCHGPLLIDGSTVALSAVPARDRKLPELSESEVLERVRTALFPELSLEDFVEDVAARGGEAISFS